MAMRDEKQEAKQKVIDLLNQRYPIEYVYQTETAVFYQDKDEQGNIILEAVKWHLKDGKAMLAYNENLVNSRGESLDADLKQKIKARIQQTLDALQRDTSISSANIDLNDSTILDKLKQQLSRPDFNTSRPGQVTMVQAMTGGIASALSEFLTKENYKKFFHATSKKLRPSTDLEWKKLCENDFPISYKRHMDHLLSEEKSLRQDFDKEKKAKAEVKDKSQNYSKLYEILMNAEYMTPAQSADKSAHRIPLKMEEMAILSLAKQPASQTNLDQLTHVLLAEEQKISNPERFSPERLKALSWDLLRSTTDKHGVCALTWARRNNRRDILDEYFKIQRQIENQGSNRLDHTITAAILSFQPQKVLEELSAKVKNPSQEMSDFEADSKTFDKCLGVAAEIGNLEAIKFFITKGANPAQFSPYSFFERGDEKFNLLQIAAIGGHLDIIKFLVEQNHVEINAMTPQGTNALHLAALYEHVDVAKYLLENIKPSEKDAFINAMGLPEVYAREKQITSAASGKTPMHIAARSKDVEMTALLAAHGADLNLKDNRGYTPVQTKDRYRRARGGDEFKSILQQQVKFSKMDDAESLRMYAFEGWSDRITKILKKNPELVNTPDEKGNTPLHYAVAGNPDVPLKKHYSIFDRDERPVTLNQERLAAITTLVQDYKGNIEAINKDGMTPLGSMVYTFLNSFIGGLSRDLIPEYALIQHLVKLGARTDTPIKLSQEGRNAHYFPEVKTIPLLEYLEKLQEKMKLNNTHDDKIDTLIKALKFKETYIMPADPEQHVTKTAEIEQYITNCKQGPDQKTTPKSNLM